MVEIRHILCPVDLSDASSHALEHALAIKRWYGSQLTALHVLGVAVPTPPILFGASAMSAPPIGTVPHAHAAEELRLWLEPRLGGSAVDMVVDEGNPAARILDHAASRHCDLIVMGTHGLSGFDRFMIGSVAEKVLRKALCPVLTVPPASQTAAKVPYTRILCAVDFSESSLAALGFALSIAEEADAQLTLLHVCEWPPEHDLAVQRYDVSEYGRQVEDEARQRLEALLTEDVREWCKPSAKIARGKPYREILRTSEREGSDLIVIGVRGRNPLDLALFGSTANHVVRRAPCPVLTLKQ